MNQLPSKTIEYSDDDLDVTLVVQKASYQMGLVRTLLLRSSWEGQEGIKNFGEQDVFEKAADIMKVMFYPNLIASVAVHKGFDNWPISVEVFLALPEELMVQWEHATFELNPQWTPAPPLEEVEILTEEEVAKKASGSGESLTTPIANQK